jgi:hypothetical protein
MQQVTRTSRPMAMVMASSQRSGRTAEALERALLSAAGWACKQNGYEVTKGWFVKMRLRQTAAGRQAVEKTR